MRNLASVAIVLAALSLAGYGFSVDDPQQATVAMQSMTVAQLEKAGDNCRAQKDYEQAIKYFKEALQRESKNTGLYNKLGLAELSSGDYVAARSDFTKATKYDRRFPDAWNNLGAVDYLQKNYGAAAKYFRKAIALEETRAAFHVNLGVTSFNQHQLERAMQEYTRALELDPEVLLHSSSAGVAARVTTREERAKLDYMIARIYARMGDVENCLECLKKAKENGFADLKNVYKQDEFLRLRQDPRLAEIVPPPPVK